MNNSFQKPLKNQENIDRRIVEVNGWRAFTLAAENDLFNKKPPIILVQGLAIVAEYWIPAITELSQDFNVYTLDLPGYGESDKPDKVLNISELAESLAAWMNAMKIDRAILVGHSFGCQIIADFVQRHAPRIERIVLAAPTMDKAARNFFVLLWRALLNARNEPLPLIWLAIKSFYKFGLIREIRTLQFALRDRIEDKLPFLTAPTLVLRGSRDTVVPQDWAELVARLLQQGRLVTIQGGTHGFNYSSSEQFAQIVKESLLLKID